MLCSFNNFVVANMGNRDSDRLDRIGTVAALSSYFRITFVVVVRIVLIVTTISIHA